MHVCLADGDLGESLKGARSGGSSRSDEGAQGDGSASSSSAEAGECASASGATVVLYSTDGDMQAGPITVLPCSMAVLRMN